MSDLIYSVFYNENFVDLTLYQFGWEHCAPLHSYGPVARNHFLFHYILSGKGTLLSTNSKGITDTYHLEAGQGFLIWPSQRNTYFADENEPWEYTWLEFDGLKAKEFVSLSGLGFDNPIYKSKVQEQSEVLKNEMLYIAHHPSESSLNLVSHLYCFMDALVKSCAYQKKIPGRNLKDFYVRECISFIEQNYQEDIKVEDIAAFCNLDRSYFGKIFKDSVSISPQEFLIKYRLTKACQLMQTTDKPIGEISTSVGYPNQLMFSKLFKKKFGVSPRLWRQMNKYRD